MMVISFLSISSCTIYCLIGFFYLNQDKRSKLTRLFFLFCLSFALWSMSKAFLSVNIIPETRIFWQKAGYLASLTYEVFILQFFIQLTGFSKKIRKPIALTCILWIIPLIFIISEILFHNIQKDFPGGFWHIGMHVFANSYNGLSIALMIWWAKKSKLRRVKLQIRLISITGIITILLTVLSDFILGSLGITSLSPVIILFWISSLFYATRKYRFMGISTRIFMHDIITGIDDYLAVIGPEGKIIMINKKLTNLTGLERNECGSTLTEPYIRHLKGKINSEATESETLKIRTFLMDSSENKIPVNARFKTLRDEFSDVLGTLFIATKALDIEHIRLRFSLTEKETDIVQQILTGQPNRIIAVDTNITENTLKAHITNIYNKLGVCSRLELLHLLKSFGISG